MRDTNGLITEDGGYEKPISGKALGLFVVASVVVYAAVSHFGQTAIVAIGAATVGAIAGMFFLKR